MGFYIGVVAITTFLSWIFSHVKEKKVKKILYILIVLFPAIISGLRGVGTDIRQYIFHADEIISGTYDLVDYKSIFVQITRFLLKHNVSFTIILIAVSIITIHTLFRIFLMYEKDINFTFAIFSYMLIYYQMSFNTYRQIMAAAFFMLATAYLYKQKNIKRFWIYYILSVLIHSSLLPFGFVYFFRNWISNKKYIKQRIIVYIVFICVIFSIPKIMNKMEFLLNIFPHYSWYLTRFYSTGIGFGLFRYLVMGVIPVVFLSLKNKSNDLKQKKLEFLPFYTMMGFILWLTSYISESSLYRISYNFLLVLPLLHGYIFCKILKKSRFALMIAVIIIMVLFWLYDGIILNTGETVPYRFIWEGVMLA